MIRYVYYGNYKEVIKIVSRIVVEIYKKYFCGGLNILLSNFLLRKIIGKKKSNG